MTAPPPCFIGSCRYSLLYLSSDLCAYCHLDSSLHKCCWHRFFLKHTSAFSLLDCHPSIEAIYDRASVNRNNTEKKSQVQGLDWKRVKSTENLLYSFDKKNKWFSKNNWGLFAFAFTWIMLIFFVILISIHFLLVIQFTVDGDISIWPKGNTNL